MKWNKKIIISKPHFLSINFSVFFRLCRSSLAGAQSRKGWCVIFHNKKSSFTSYLRRRREERRGGKPLDAYWKNEDNFHIVKRRENMKYSSFLRFRIWQASFCGKRFAGGGDGRRKITFLLVNFYGTFCNLIFSLLFAARDKMSS